MPDAVVDITGRTLPRVEQNTVVVQHDANTSNADPGQAQDQTQTTDPPQTAQDQPVDTTPTTTTTPAASTTTTTTTTPLQQR